jgi:hypothetical protein
MPYLIFVRLRGWLILLGRPVGAGNSPQVAGEPAYLGWCRAVSFI